MSDWETRAIRSARRFGRIDLAEDPPRPGPATEAPARPRQDENRADWVTLREAHALTSIPLETMRKWARRGAITSYLEHGGTRSLRMVSLADVLARAETLGRSVSPIDSIVIDDSSSADALQTEQPATGRTPPADGSVRGTAPPQPRPVIRSDSQQHSDDPTGDALREETPATGGNIASADGKPDQGTPEGTMIVPIAGWDKMLIQLGNLHEAGQQLAEARERAARAETEVHFLRERLAEIRTADAATASPPAIAQAEPAIAPPGSDQPLHGGARRISATQSLWRTIRGRWRQ